MGLLREPLFIWDSMKKLLDFDPFSGIETYYHDDPVGGGFHIERHHQDVEPQLDMTERLRNDEKYQTKDRDWKHYAHIPNIILEKWMNELGVDMWTLMKDRKRLFQLLNDPEYSKLKVTYKHHQPK